MIDYMITHKYTKCTRYNAILFGAIVCALTTALFLVTSGLPCSSLTTASCSSVQHFCGGLCGCAHNGAFVAVTDASRLAILELDTQQWSLMEDRGSWLDRFVFGSCQLENHQTSIL